MNGPILRSDINTFVEQAKFADELFIGTQVCPPVPVPQIAGKYPVVTIASGGLLKTGQPKPRAWASEAPIIETAWTTDGFECLDLTIKQRVDTVLNDYTSQFGFDQMVMAAKMCKRWQLAQLEQTIANTLFSTSTFSGLSAPVAYLNANTGTVTFPSDVNTLKVYLTKFGVNPARATMIIPLEVYNYIILTQNFQYFVRGNRPQDSYIGLVGTKENLASLAALFGIKEVIIGQFYADTTNFNNTAKTIANSPGLALSSNTNVWSTKYIWLGVVGEGDFSGGGASRLLYYDQAGSMLSTQQYYLSQYRSTDIEVSLFSIPKVIDPTQGVLLTTGYTGS